MRSVKKQRETTIDTLDPGSRQIAVEEERDGLEGYATSSALCCSFEEAGCLCVGPTGDRLDPAGDIRHDSLFTMARYGRPHQYLLTSSHLGQTRQVTSQSRDLVLKSLHDLFHCRCRLGMKMTIEVSSVQHASRHNTKMN